MCAVRGEGANNAMLDGVELGDQLAKAISEFGGTKAAYEDALRKYEEGMMPRATKAVLLSRAEATGMNPKSIAGRPVEH